MARQLTGADKAAVLLLAMGEEAAGTILAGMPHNEAAKVVAALSRLGRVEEAVADAVLLEFSERLAHQDKKFLVGDAAGAKRLLKAALPGQSEAFDQDLGLAGSTLTQTLAGFAAEDLARFLRHEHPQTLALVLAHLEPRPCGAVLKLLPESLHAEVILRIARLEAVDPQVLMDLEDSVRDGIGRNRTLHSQKKGGPAPVAAMLAALDQKAREEQLEKLAERDPVLADAVRALLFVFADLASLDDRGLQELLKIVPEAQLKLALKGASDELQARFFGNMSQRRAQALREDLAAMAKTRLSEVEAAQQALAGIARKLMEDGKILDPRAAA